VKYGDQRHMVILNLAVLSRILFSFEEQTLKYVALSLKPIILIISTQILVEIFQDSEVI
jgi:hypothetical protein